MLLLSALIVISIDITITFGSNVTTGTTSNVGYYNSDYITTTNSMGLIEESSPKPDDDWESGKITHLFYFILLTMRPINRLGLLYVEKKNNM